MLLILVQIQAGPPRFALTGYAWRSHAETVRPKRVRRSLSEANAKTDWGPTSMSAEAETDLRNADVSQRKIVPLAQ